MTIITLFILKATSASWKLEGIGEEDLVHKILSGETQKSCFETQKP